MRAGGRGWEKGMGKGGPIQIWVLTFASILSIFSKIVGYIHLNNIMGPIYQISPMLSIFVEYATKLSLLSKSCSYMKGQGMEG